MHVIGKRAGKEQGIEAKQQVQCAHAHERPHHGAVHKQEEQHDEQRVEVFLVELRHGELWNKDQHDQQPSTPAADAKEPRYDEEPEEAEGDKEHRAGSSKARAQLCGDTASTTLFGKTIAVEDSQKKQPCDDGRFTLEPFDMSDNRYSVL